MQLRAKKVILGLEKLRVECDINLEPACVDMLLSVAYGNEVAPKEIELLETLESKLAEIGGIVNLCVDKLILYYITDISLNEILPFRVRQNLDIECISDNEIEYSIPEVVLSDDWLMFYDKRKTKEDFEYGPDRLQKIPKGAELVPYKDISKTYLELNDIYEYLDGFMLGPVYKEDIKEDTIVVKRN